MCLVHHSAWFLHEYIKHLLNEYLPRSIHFFILLDFSMFQSVQGILNPDSNSVFVIPSCCVIHTYDMHTIWVLWVTDNVENDKAGVKSWEDLLAYILISTH